MDELQGLRLVKAHEWQTAHRLVCQYQLQGRPRESIDRMLRATGFTIVRGVPPRIFTPNDRRKVPRE